MSKFDLSEPEAEKIAVLGASAVASVARLWATRRLLQHIWPDTGWQEAWLVSCVVQSIGAWFHQGWRQDEYVAEKTSV